MRVSDGGFEGVVWEIGGIGEACYVGESVEGRKSWRYTSG